MTSIDIGCATDIGARDANADAVTIEQTPRGTGAAVVDGIGSSEAVCRAARRAAETAAVVASHRDAQAGLMAAADTMPDYPKSPNAVSAVVSIDPDGRIEIAHCGDAAVHTWSPEHGLLRWTADQTLAAWLSHTLRSSSPTPAGRSAIEKFAAAEPALGSFVLSGLNYATINTISWTPLRAPHHRPSVVLLTSDGVHKAIGDDDGLHTLIEQHHGYGAQCLATELVRAGVTESRTDPDETVDNATAAVLIPRWAA